MRTFKGLLFDVNGTVTDILTDENYDDIYRMMSNLLDYQGVKLAPEAFRRLFFDIIKRQKRDSGEEHPEFDVTGIFAEILKDYAGAYTAELPPGKREWLPVFLSEAFRAASRFKLEPYADVIGTLEGLRRRYRLAAVSDGQGVWARPELWSAGLGGYFETVIVSSDLGYRKPDRRLFRKALKALDLSPEEVLFVGNDMYRDIWGGHEMGMKTVFFRSNQGDWKSRGVEADYIIYNFRELPEAIAFLEKQS